MTSDTIGQLRQKGLLCLVSKANSIISDAKLSAEKDSNRDNFENVTSVKCIIERLAITWGRDDDILLIKLLETIARVI